MSVQSASWYLAYRMHLSIFLPLYCATLLFKVAMLECGLSEREDLLRDGLAVMQSEAISLSRRSADVILLLIFTLFFSHHQILSFHQSVSQSVSEPAQ